MGRRSLAAVLGVALLCSNAARGQHISHGAAAMSGNAAGLTGLQSLGQGGAVSITSPYFGGAGAVSGGFGGYPYGSWDSWGGNYGYGGYGMWGGGMPASGLMFPNAMMMNGGMPFNGVAGNGMNVGNGAGPLIPAAANLPPNQGQGKPSAKTSAKAKRSKSKKARSVR